ncbi:MAG: hypothetical protein ACLS48_09340 [[Eubacterium] siraeum]
MKNKKNLENEIEEKQALIGRLKADSEQLTEELTESTLRAKRFRGSIRSLTKSRVGCILKERSCSFRYSR